LVVVEKVLSFIFLISAAIILLGFGFTYEYMSWVTGISAMVIIGILIYSAFSKPKNDLIHLSVYGVGILYYTVLLFRPINSMFLHDYIKVFDLIYPLSIIIAFLFKIYFAKKK
jgi:hypothetical protein